MIEVVGKLSDRIMTSTWILHAKRQFELESRRLSLFDRTASPIRELRHHQKVRGPEGTRHIAFYPRISDSLQTTFAPMQVRRPEHGRVSEVPVRWQAFKQWSPEAEFSGIIRVRSIGVQKNIFGIQKDIYRVIRKTIDGYKNLFSDR